MQIIETYGKYIEKWANTNPDRARVLLKLGWEVQNLKYKFTPDKLGHKVVAEGVETQEEIDLLKQWGVDLVQGYYYTKPLDSEQIIHKLEKDVC